MKKILLLVLVLAILPHVAAESLIPEGLESPEVLLMADLGLIIAAATVMAFVAAGLKQPLIPAYIIAGVLIGPVGAEFLFGGSIISDPGFIEALSELGITFLLFTVGIELDLSRLKDVGKAALIIGTAQVGLTFVLGFGVALLLGFGGMGATYLGLILAFSSTMVVIKILSDRDEIETLHGRIMLGILLMQDIVVVIVLSILASPGEAIPLNQIAVSVIQAIGLFSFAIILSKFVASKILKAVANSVELVFLVSLSFLFVFALASHLLGFSTAIGGFLGGISLAVFPYNLEVANRIKPLRDFFAIMFFVSLGMQFYPVADFEALVLPIIIFTALILLVKPFLITFLSILTGYERRTAFLAGMGLGQVSEFSLILVLGLVAIGPEMGPQMELIFPMTLILALITISLTPYLIKYGNRIYVPFSGIFERFERLSFIKKRHNLEHMPNKCPQGHIIVFGAHIMGMEVIETLQKLKKNFIVVDHNPDIIKKLMKRKIPCVYGDLEDVEVQKRICLKDAKFVISTVPDEDDSMLLIKKVKEENPKAVVFVTAKTIDHAIKFYREGADFIIHLKILGGREASEQLEAALKDGHKKMRKIKLKEIERLEKKKRDEIIDRIDEDFLKEIDALRAEAQLKKSETLGEE